MCGRIKENIDEFKFACEACIEFLLEEGSEEKEPEMLVFGAELKCTQGTQHGFLMITANSICLNGLPQANVSDSKISENITPFGDCLKGAPCLQIAELQKEWINPVPQKITVRGKEAITTESSLLCDRCGEITVVNSGQDGVEATRLFEEMELFGEIEEKYPGLLEILMDPYGSLYLTAGMYQKALQFLNDCVERHGGEIQIISLGSPNTLEDMLMNMALGHLVLEFDTSTEVWLEDQLTKIGTDMGFDGVPGWNVKVLNEDTMGFITEICEKRSEEIENNWRARWSEKNKELGMNLCELANTIAFMYIANQCSMEAQQEKGVDFEEQGLSDKLNKAREKLKEVTNKLRKGSQTEHNSTYKGYSDFADGMSPEDAARYIANNEKAFYNEFAERAAKAGLNNEQITKAYEAMRTGNYKKMALYFDTSSPIDGAVFWSGNKEAASAYAKSIDGTILEQTTGGKMFDNWRELQGMYPEWESGQKPIWEALSSLYANNAKGIVTYVHPSRYKGKVWLNVERPILRRNDIIIEEVIINAK